MGGWTGTGCADGIYGKRGVMKRIDIDFARTRARAGWLWLLAGLVVAGGQWWFYQRAVAARDQALAMHDARQAGSASATKPPPSLPGDATAEKARANLAVRWDVLFDALESATHKNVALLDVQPDGAKGMIKLAAEARNEDAMFAYLYQLSRQPGVTNVVLKSQTLQTADPQQPVRFSLTAQWTR
jgi:hypothetical protein